jgi:hypothetical protein
VFDVIRGVTKVLETSNTGAEDATNDPPITSFDSGGFTVEGTYAQTNASGASYVAWTWDAGSSTVTNTQGSITSQVRANASAGFSVVSWTGTGAAGTIGHGLGIVPKLIIIKARTAVTNWVVLTTAVDGSHDYLYLNLTNAKGDDNLLSFTSSTFDPGGGSNANPSGQDMIAYCFAPVAGYSSFGSYTGNGSADGPFVYTGFRPRWLMVKCTGTATSTTSWIIWDSSRNTYNMAETPLRADLSSQEILASDNYDIDIFSNGFKFKNLKRRL